MQIARALVVSFFVLAAPVFNEPGKVVGVLRGEFNFSQIQTIIEGVTLGERGYVYLVDEEMDVVAHPNREFVARHVTRESIPLSGTRTRWSRELSSWIPRPRRNSSS